VTEHSYFADRISAYHDGYLSGQELELIKRHIEECEECRKALADLEKLDRIVDEQSQLDGEEYWEKSAQRIEKQIAESSGEKVVDIRRSRFGTFGMRIAAVAASFVIIGYVALHESDILNDLPDEFPREKPVVRAPSPPIPDKAELATKVGPTSDVEPALIEQPTEELDVAADDLHSEKRAAKQSIPEGRGVADKKGVAEKKVPPAPMEPDYINDAAVVSTQGIESVAVSPADQVASPVLAGDERSEDVVELELADITRRLDKAGSVRGERDMIDFAPSVELQSMEVGPFGQSTDTTLTEWREVRDENVAAYPQAAPDMAVAYSAEGTKSKVSRQRSTADSGLVPDEELLLRAWYQIALNTDDPDERAEAVSFLDQYVKDEKARFPALAGDYLKELEESSE